MLKFVIVDDHEALAEMTARVLGQCLGCGPGAVISTFFEASTRLPDLAPNLVVLDNRLEDGCGLDLVRSLRCEMSQTRWLLYSAYASARTLREAISAGVDGTVAKRAPLSVLIEAASALLAGRRFFCEITAKELRENGGDETLIATERKIIEYISIGMEAKEIAAVIGVAHKTVLNSLVSIRRKTGTSSMVQISDYARKNGLSIVDQ